MDDEAYARFFATKHNEPKPRPQLPGQFFSLRPDGLKIVTPYPGDGVRFFDDAQLRSTYPQIAEDAIAFRDGNGFPNVTIDQVQDRIVRLRSSHECVCDRGHKAKLLYGKTLGRRPRDFANQLILLPPTRYEPVVAHDEQRRPLSNAELQAREAGRAAPTRWKWWYLRSANEWFVAPEAVAPVKPPPDQLVQKGKAML